MSPRAKKREPKFSRRHYEMIADVIRAFSPVSPDDRDDLIELFVSQFEADNPRFDGKKFRTRCWLTQ